MSPPGSCRFLLPDHGEVLGHSAPSTGELSLGGEREMEVGRDRQRPEAPGVSSCMKAAGMRREGGAVMAGETKESRSAGDGGREERGRVKKEGQQMWGFGLHLEGVGGMAGL